MTLTNIDKLKPVVIKALVNSSKPEAKKSLAMTTITLLNKRIDQLDAEISYAEAERYLVRKILKELLDNFPESDEGFSDDRTSEAMVGHE